MRAAGRRAITIQADIGDEHAVAAMFDRCAAELGPVEAFVSNAGMIHKAAPLADIPVAEIRRIVEVDLTAHLICCREAVRRMSTKRGGRGGAIVLMSSMASELLRRRRLRSLRCRQGRHRRADHRARQGGGRARGSGSPACGPGLIDTDMQDETGIENRIARFGPTVPIGRAGTRGRGGRGRARGCCRIGPPMSRQPCSTSPAAAEADDRMDEYLSVDSDPACGRLRGHAGRAGLAAGRPGGPGGGGGPRRTACSTSRRSCRR